MNCEAESDERKFELPSKLQSVVSVGIIREVHKRNLKRTALGHLNFNSTRNKFDILIDQITGTVDVMFISERKPDGSFLNGLFKVQGYALSFRLDHNQFGDGIMVL